MWSQHNQDSGAALVLRTVSKTPQGEMISLAPCSKIHIPGEAVMIPGDNATFVLLQLQGAFLLSSHALMYQGLGLPWFDQEGGYLKVLE